MKELIPIASQSDMIVARQRGRELARSLGFNLLDQTKIAIGISELARNILIYAKEGRIELEQVCHGESCGIEVRAVDNGPGIPDVPMAMIDGYSTSDGLGMGLPGTRRIMDDFDLETEQGKGTKITIRKWMSKEMYERQVGAECHESPLREPPVS